MLRSFLLLCTGTALLSCGARSSLQDDGAGGAPGNAGSTVASVPTDAVGSTGTGFDPPPTCRALRLDGDPVLFFDPVAGAIHDPDLVITARDETMFTWMWLDTPMADPTMDPDAVWPDPLDARNGIEANIASYALGPAPDGPVMLARSFDGTWRLTYGLFELGVAPEFLQLTGDPSFVVGSGRRFLFGTIAEGIGLLTIGEHEIGTLPIAPDELHCVTDRPLGDAVAVDDGFVAAFTSGRLSSFQCIDGSEPGTQLQVARYTPASPAIGSPLVATVSQTMTASEPFAALALAPSPDGGWMVWKTDGSTSRTAPPYVAKPFDAFGGSREGTELAVSDTGISAVVMDAASMGDALAVAFVDDRGFDGASITVQRVEPEPGLGASLTFPADIGFDARLRVVATASQRSLILTWENPTRDEVWLAKVECVD